MIHRIEILTAPHLPDPAGQSLLARLRRFTDLPLQDVRTCAVYALDSAALDGALPDGAAARELEQLAQELFADPILHWCRLDGGMLEAVPFDWYVEVSFRPGVTDNVGRTAQESLEYRLGRALAPGHQVHTAAGYLLRGALGAEQVQGLAQNWLSNPLIQQALILPRKQVGAQHGRLFHLPKVSLQVPLAVEHFALRSAERLLELSRQRLLALSRAEAKAICAYYAQPAVHAARTNQGLGPEATDVELEMLAQTWSEHCKHKIFNAEIDYTGPDGRTQQISSLFKTCIQGATRAVRQALGGADFCLSVFTDNAGVVKFDERWSLVFKVETHNSPSALDPYGGALTGIVGVNRDPFGTGRGAELLFNTDVFCFASPFYDRPLPPRLLHP
ncbi:MAG TPA: AIR synthase related protein, partial [bacterium]|nr:AIR synthase related protein [bacterium]